jgi:hypothetical protein
MFDIKIGKYFIKTGSLAWILFNLKYVVEAAGLALLFYIFIVLCAAI